MTRGAASSPAPWIQTINRLLGSEQRPDPRPKQGHKPQLKYWNQSDLVVAAAIRGNTLSDIMRGKRKPTLETLEAVGAALGQPVFLFLMEPEEAAQYETFRRAQTAETHAATKRVTAEQLASELAPQFATIIEQYLTGQSVGLEAKPLATSKPTLQSAAVQKPKRKGA